MNNNSHFKVTRKVQLKMFSKGVIALAAAFIVGQALAFEIPVENPDVTVRWDNTLRYNLGVRVEDQDPAILATDTYDSSDAKFGRGDIVMNRVDMLSEFDIVYKKKHGLRVSATLWGDGAYSDTSVKKGPGMTSHYPGDSLNDDAKRWYRGPSGEFLDAFVFTGFDAGAVPVNLRIGQHTVYWGESLFSFVHGVSYAQGPVDLRLAAATPGISAKELFKPVPQVSGTAQLSNELSVSAQYIAGWKPNTLPYGGTYFGAYDFVSGGGTNVAPGFPYVGTLSEPDKQGDWGVMTRWSPQALNGGTLGFYYRKYTDTQPFVVPNATFTALGKSYLNDRSTLVGVSYAGSVSGVSVAGELVHRSNGALFQGPATTLGTEPVGDTWHALANAIAYFGSNPLFDAAALTAEVTYSRLDKIKKNEASYGGTGCTAAYGCPTQDAWGMALKFEPTWYAVQPGVDLSMPFIYTRGIKGVSPVALGGAEGSGTISLGLNATVKEKYILTLAYNDSFNKSSVVNGQVASTADGGAQWDHGWLSFTFKTDF